MKTSNDSTTKLVATVVSLASLGAAIGHFAGIGVVELWFRPDGALPAREVAAAPYVFTIVGCLLGTLAGMGWTAYVSATRAIRMSHADPHRERGRHGHEDVDSV
jgi:hypothetical protein